MPIPSQKDIQIPLLHLIYSKGGKVEPMEVFDELAAYFGLTEEETEEKHRSGGGKFYKRIAWARYYLCEEGLLDRSSHGIWKITEKGKKELSRLRLVGRPFSGLTPSKDQGALSAVNPVRESESDDEKIIELILQEIAPDGPKKFPDDFLDDNCTDFYEVELPGTQLQFAPAGRGTTVKS